MQRCDSDRTVCRFPMEKQACGSNGHTWWVSDTLYSRIQNGQLFFLEAHAAFVGKGSGYKSRLTGAMFALHSWAELLFYYFSLLYSTITQPSFSLLPHICSSLQRQVPFLLNKAPECQIKTAQARISEGKAESDVWGWDTLCWTDL